MANALLDFVMSLVRDPDAAARYAADPAGALADAHLTDVTSADVNNLIPMVADSMSMAAPPIGVGHSGDASVWASGAATAAFDAFGASPEVVSEPSGVVTVPDHGVIEQPADIPYVRVVDPAFDDGSAQAEGADAQPWTDQPDTAWSDTGGWERHHADDSHSGTEHLGFDLF